ncbi:MAG: hypothetical protein J6S45_03350 [Firmicutes bacterium]|nr:hypothetical protein [Bacillota bacterium]
MDEQMKDVCYYQKLIEKGEINGLVDMIREDPEILAFSHDFTKNEPVLMEFWNRYPSMARMVMRELLGGNESGQIVKMLEALSCPFRFQWERCNCDVNGNFLFRLVWDGEYELVRTMLEQGADPDGVCKSIYIMKGEKHLSPYRRWGKMKCREEKDEFFMFNRWDDPWGVMEGDQNTHVITPLYLAELRKDENMSRILREAGAHSVPSREKMWEDARAPKDGGSIFGNL